MVNVALERHVGVVESHDRRHNHNAQIGEFLHVAQVNFAEGHFARYQNQAAVFLDTNVGGAEQEIIAVAADNSGDGFHGARHDNHSVGQETAAGYGGVHFANVVDHVGKFVYRIHVEVGFIANRQRAAVRDYQVRFDGFDLSQALQKFHRKHNSARARYPYDYSHRNHLPKNFSRVT